MRFDIGDVSSVQATTQRNLAEGWFAARSIGHLPPYIGWTVDHRDELSELKACRVEFGPPTPRYLVRYHGKIIEMAYGTSLVGKYLNDVVPYHLHAPTLHAYDACVKVQAPIYTITEFSDAKQARVDCEQLLLPFGDKAVTDIVASVNFISSAGDFVLQGMMSVNAETRIPIVAKILTDTPLALGPSVTIPIDWPTNTQTH